MVGVEHDVDVVELGLGCLRDDGGLFALGATFERVAHAEQSRRRSRCPRRCAGTCRSAVPSSPRPRPRPRARARRARRRPRRAPGGVRRSRPHVRSARRIASLGAGGAGGADPAGDDVRRHARGRAPRHPVRRLGPRRLRSAVGRGGRGHRRRRRRHHDFFRRHDRATGQRRRGDHHRARGDHDERRGRCRSRCAPPDRRAPDRVGRHLHRGRRRPVGGDPSGQARARDCRSSSRRARTSR